MALGSQEPAGGQRLISGAVIECCLYVLLKLENPSVDLVMCYFSVSQICLIREIVCVAY